MKDLLALAGVMFGDGAPAFLWACVYIGLILAQRKLLFRINPNKDNVMGQPYFEDTAIG
ncbi:hypothetical protein [Mucilaginibacter paludis]|uniref:hypothetical protein n=1 Tax=Mucilaginibacter paludis TaxID=423351 RepID=UPI0002F88529|nr:hypothetical protein [Mucilaginibacter paludis]